MNNTSKNVVHIDSLSPEPFVTQSFHIIKIEKTRVPAMTKKIVILTISS